MSNVKCQMTREQKEEVGKGDAGDEKGRKELRGHITY